MSIRRIPQFFTVEALMERWGVSRAKILGWVDAGEIGFVDLAGDRVKRRGKGRREVGFTERHVVEFEAARSRRFPAVATEGAPPLPEAAPLPGVWDGQSRLGGGTRTRSRSR